ncbi:MAG: crotonase/enoyl-CoA hydratase family protein [Myxococcales bacterium]|nr:crotonase/enoyl-CoA hydratase family protein [Myxococcales bacterium]
MSEQRVTIEIEEGVAQVRLNRADKLNAIDGAMFSALSEAGDAIAADNSVRAVVLSGAGRAFCAGLDFQSFAAMAGRGEAPVQAKAEQAQQAQQTHEVLSREAQSPANRAQRAGWVWQEVPVPVIAAVHGFAYGGGLQIALGADIRFLAPGTKLSVMEIKWGLVPDMSGTQTLRRLVRLDVAKELAFTGRVAEAEEALALGLATHVVDDPLAAATAMAREIASKSPHAIRNAKRLFNETGYGSVAEGFALEQELQRELIGTPNQAEAVQANLEKRAPRFEDP